MVMKHTPHFFEPYLPEQKDLCKNAVYFIKAKDSDCVVIYVTSNKPEAFPVCTVSSQGIQPGDNVSLLINDSGYITISDLPIPNGLQGTLEIGNNATLGYSISGINGNYYELRNAFDSAGTIINTTEIFSTPNGDSTQTSAGETRVLNINDGYDAYLRPNELSLGSESQTMQIHVRGDFELEEEQAEVILRNKSGTIALVGEAGESQLEKITEAGKTGYRLLDMPAEKYANIGNHAVDLTDNSDASYTDTNYGVAVDYGFSAGAGNKVSGNFANYAIGFNNNVAGFAGNGALGAYNNLNSGYASWAIGCYHTVNNNSNGFGFTSGMNNFISDVNSTAIGMALISKSRSTVALGVANTNYPESGIDSARPIMVVGNGTTDTPAGAWNATSRSDAFRVRFDGRVEAPSMTTAQIDADTTGKILVNKNWVEVSTNVIVQEKLSNGITANDEQVEVFNDTFDRTGLGANYTNLFSDGTINVSAGKLTIAGTNPAYFTNYIKRNFDTVAENFTMTVRFQPKDTGFGFATGIVSENAFGYAHHNFVGMTTSGGNIGKLYFNFGASSTTLATSTQAVTVSIVNTYKITIIRTGYTYNCYLLNETTQETASITIDLYGTVTAANNAGKPCIMLLSGTTDIFDWSYVINESTGTPLLLKGDSITYGQSATTIEDRYASKISDNVVVMAGGADVTASVVATLPEIILMKPKYCSLMIGGNDLLFAVPEATWKANLVSIVTTLKANNIIPILLLPTPRTVHDITALKNYILTQFASEIIIDTFTPLVAVDGVTLNPIYDADGIHPNNLGHSIIAQTISIALEGIVNFEQPFNIPVPIQVKKGVGLSDAVNLEQLNLKSNLAGGNVFTGTQTFSNLSAFLGETVFYKILDQTQFLQFFISNDNVIQGLAIADLNGSYLPIKFTGFNGSALSEYGYIGDTESKIKSTLQISNAILPNHALALGQADEKYVMQSQILSGSAVLDFPDTMPGESSEQTITITGALVGDVVAIGVPDDSTAPGSCFTGRVSATDTVTIKLNNYSSILINPISGTFKAKVFKD